MFKVEPIIICYYFVVVLDSNWVLQRVESFRIIKIYRTIVGDEGGLSLL